MARLRYSAAIAKAIEDAIVADERVVVIGNNFGGLGEHQRPFDDLAARHEDRVLLPPWSELAVIGAGVGASATGLRPVVDVATGSFVFQGWPQVVNEAANVACTSGGQTRAPVVIHMLAGMRRAGAAQHSHRPQAMLWNAPGLQIVLPATPTDAYGLMRTALLDSQDPTVFVSNAGLFDLEEDVAEEPIAFGQARVAREGDDVTVIATSVMVPRALRAAAELADEHGVSVEVVDPRTIAPLDQAALVRSVRKTGRLVVADECHRSAGVAAEIVARVAESAFDALKAPPQRVVAPDLPVPLSPPLEDAVTPTADHIVRGVLQTLQQRTPSL